MDEGRRGDGRKDSGQGRLFHRYSRTCICNMSSTCGFTERGAKMRKPEMRQSSAMRMNSCSCSNIRAARTRFCYTWETGAAILTWNCIQRRRGYWNSPVRCFKPRKMARPESGDIRLSRFHALLREDTEGTVQIGTYTDSKTPNIIAEAVQTKTALTGIAAACRHGGERDAVRSGTNELAPTLRRARNFPSAHQRFGFVGGWNGTRLRPSESSTCFPLLQTFSGKEDSCRDN